MAKKRRLNHCYAPGCKTGYARTHQDRRFSLFKAPADEERRLAWQRNLHRLDKPLDADCAVCELHFEPHFILRDYVHVINGTEVRTPRGTPTLAPDAVPTILPNLPAHLSKRTPAPRPQRKRRQVTPAESDRKYRRTDERSPSPSQSPSTSAAVGVDEASDVVAGLEELRKLALPSKSWALHEFPDLVGVSYVACDLNPRTSELAIGRAVFFHLSNEDSVEYKVFLLNKLVEASRLVTVQEATDLLKRAARIPLCCGAADPSSVSSSELTEGLKTQMQLKRGVFFNVHCMGKSQKEGFPCVNCKYLRKALQTRKSRLKGRPAKTTRNTAR
ncbi:unnamed protein product, partial [Ixodes hexagonus]